MSLVREFWDFMKMRKKFWLAPVIVVSGGAFSVHYSGQHFTGHGSANLYAILTA